MESGIIIKIVKPIFAITTNDKNINGHSQKFTLYITDNLQKFAL